MAGTQAALLDHEEQSHALGIKKKNVEAVCVPDDFGTVRIVLPSISRLILWERELDVCPIKFTVFGFLLISPVPNPTWYNY